MEFHCVGFTYDQISLDGSQESDFSRICRNELIYTECSDGVILGPETLKKVALIIRKEETRHPHYERKRKEEERVRERIDLTIPLTLPIAFFNSRRLKPGYEGVGKIRKL